MSRFEAHAKAEPTAEEFQARDDQEARRQGARFQREHNASATAAPGADRQPVAELRRRHAERNAAADAIPTAAALPEAMESLVRSFGLAALIDAAWAAAARIFQPRL